MRQYLDLMPKLINAVWEAGDKDKKHYPTFQSTANKIAELAALTLEDWEDINNVSSVLNDNIGLVSSSITPGETDIYYVKKLDRSSSWHRANFASHLWEEKFLTRDACDLICRKYTNGQPPKTSVIGFVAAAGKDRQWQPVKGKFETIRKYSSRTNRKSISSGYGLLFPDSSTVKLNAVFNRFTPYCWRVGVSIDSSPKMYFMTDAIGVRELLKERDVREGKVRRDALLHWVSEHWRINRFDTDEEVRVRKHLRGMRHAICFGFNCEIEESDFDKREALEAKINRKYSKNRRRSKFAY